MAKSWLYLAKKWFQIGFSAIGCIESYIADQSVLNSLYLLENAHIGFQQSSILNVGLF